ncbi:hypothetical protein K1719_041981 [Acacia pycnantha]|nr:hypothetical protein K1719_041981 [Acacia pycnantha]
MIKQILNRLPRKPSKAVENRGGERLDSFSSLGLNHGDKFFEAVNSKLNGSLPASSYEALPSFRDVPNSEKQNMFIRKLQMCCVVFDFSDPMKNLKEKDIKRQTLVELVDYISAASGKFTENMMQEIVKMVSTNLFRTLTSPPCQNKVLEAFDVEEEEPSMDPAWSHLQIVYEFLLRGLQGTGLLEDSSSSHIWEIYELLEILGSIINGFALPLKEEHKLFLVRVLIPLHKPKCIPLYHQQLSYCITQFVEKDCKLADTVIRGLLKYWPVTNSSKEVMFLGELEEVLEATQPSEFQRCMVPLFHQLSRCLSSSHFQVAERALFLWNNDHIESLIKPNRKIILPLVLPALEKNEQSHWNPAVLSLTINVRKIFFDADPELYDECLIKFKEDEGREEDVKSKQEAKWKRLEEIAAMKAASNEPVLVSPRNVSRASSG